MPTSNHHYEAGKLFERIMVENNLPFYGLIQAAMRMADTDNLAMLQACWPEEWEDLQQRYNAPGGILPTDGEQP